jgi:hypothetical protein
VFVETGSSYDTVQGNVCVLFLDDGDKELIKVLFHGQNRLAILMWKILSAGLCVELRGITVHHLLPVVDHCFGLLFAASIQRACSQWDPKKIAEFDVKEITKASWSDLFTEADLAWRCHKWKW